MKSSSRFVGMGATALAWLVGVGAASSAGAQSASAPYFYLWGPPETGVSGPAFLQHASQMVRIYADSYDGALAAKKVAEKADGQRDAGVTDPNHICLVLETSGL